MFMALFFCKTDTLSPAARSFAPSHMYCSALQNHINMRLNSLKDYAGGFACLVL